MSLLSCLRSFIPTSERMVMRFVRDADLGDRSDPRQGLAQVRIRSVLTVALIWRWPRRSPAAPGTVPLDAVRGLVLFREQVLERSVRGIRQGLAGYAGRGCSVQLRGDPPMSLRASADGPS